MKAIWNNQLIAESDNTKVVENNHYFSPESVKKEFIEESEHHSSCSWKGEASYYDLVVDGEKNENAVWYYPEPKEKASHIEGYVAFWNGVEVKES